MPKIAHQSKLAVEQDQEFLQGGPEVWVFLVCLGMVNELRAARRAVQDGELTRDGFLSTCNVVVAHFTETVRATERFDLVLPVIEFGQFSPYFWGWFNWWDDYLRNLPAKDVRRIERLARQRSPAAAKHRPAGDWLKHRQTAAFTMVSA